MLCSLAVDRPIIENAELLFSTLLYSTLRCSARSALLCSARLCSVLFCAALLRNALKKTDSSFCRPLQHLHRMSERARDQWQIKWLSRNEDITQLRKTREEIIEDDSYWESSIENMAKSTSRLSALVCPPEFYSDSKPVWEFTGSWKTNDWQHFMERLAAFALYGCLDDDRYHLTLELFDILSTLTRYSHRRSDLQALRTRVNDMLSEHARLGPVQDQSIMFHLILHLLDQAIRWGPPVRLAAQLLQYGQYHVLSGRRLDVSI